MACAALPGSSASKNAEILILRHEVTVLVNPGPLSGSGAGQVIQYLGSAGKLYIPAGLHRADRQAVAHQCDHKVLCELGQRVAVRPPRSQYIKQ